MAAFTVSGGPVKKRKAAPAQVDIVLMSRARWGAFQRGIGCFSARSTACFSCFEAPRSAPRRRTLSSASPPSPASMRSTTPPSDGARAPTSGSFAHAPAATHCSAASSATGSTPASRHAHHSRPSSRFSLDSPRRAPTPGRAPVVAHSVRPLWASNAASRCSSQPRHAGASAAGSVAMRPSIDFSQLRVGWVSMPRASPAAPA